MREITPAEREGTMEEHPLHAQARQAAAQWLEAGAPNTAHMLATAYLEQMEANGVQFRLGDHTGYGWLVTYLQATLAAAEARGHAAGRAEVRSCIKQVRDALTRTTRGGPGTDSAIWACDEVEAVLRARGGEVREGE